MNDATEYQLTEAYAIINSGVSCMSGPEDDVTMIESKILNTIKTVIQSQTYGYIFDCDDVANLPSF